MFATNKEYGVDKNVTNRIVGFKLEGETSPNDAILAPSSTDGTSPLPHTIVEPPQYMRGNSRSSNAQASNPPSRLNSFISGSVTSNTSGLNVSGGLVSNLSNLSNLSSFSAGPAAYPLITHTSLPQPPTPTAPLPDAGPPAILSAPNSPPTGTSKKASTATATPSTAAASAASSAAAPPAPSDADLAAMSKAERRAYYEALNQGRPKEPAAKMSKEERRAKQEAERAQKAKQSGKGPSSISSASSKSSRPTPTPTPTPAAAPAAAAASASAAAPAAPQKEVIELVSHLQASLDLGSDSVLRALRASGYHDEILHLGWRYHKCLVIGGTARTRTMLKALQEVVEDYHCPPGKEPARDIAAHISHQVGFLAAVRRPLGLHMGNAVRHLKSQIGKLKPGLPEVQVKAEVMALIERFEVERIRLPLRQIALEAARLIEPGDYIVTFCRSEAVLRALIEAHKTMSAEPNMPRPPFTVGVVDNSETQEGRRALAVLQEHGIDAVYDCSVSLAPSALSRATKVFLGAAAVLANGAVYTRAGALGLAQAAKFQGTPVLVLCETFKFHERHQVSPTTHNELGDWQRGLLEVPEHPPRPYKAAEEGAGEVPGFSLRYCLVPPACIDKIICEAAAVPPAGVVAQMRGHRKEAAGKY